MRQVDEPSLPKPDGWSPLQPEGERELSEAQVEAIRGIGTVALGADLAALPSSTAGSAHPARIFSVTAAVAIHLGVLVGLVVAGADADHGRVGAGGQLLEGLGIEIVTDAELATLQAPRIAAAALVMAGESNPIFGAIDRAPPVEASDPAGAAAKAADTPGEEQREPPRDVAGAAVAAPPDPVAAPPEVPVVEVARQPEPKAGDDEAVPAPQQQARVEVAEPVADAASEQKAFRPPSVDASTDGGAAPSIVQSAMSAGLPAAAAPGDVTRLGRLVQLAIEKVRPAPIGVRGRVVIEITVGEGGGLEAIGIHQSSGNPRLDDAAMAAARRVDFPAPGPLFSRTQRIYRVPYLFK